MLEYKTTRKIFKIGGKKGSLVVTLPRIWVDANKINQGDSVEISFDSYPYLKIQTET